jgi:uncharacterized OsmC-like protein
MTDSQKPKMTFDVRSEWVSHTASVSYCKNAKIDLDTNMAGSPDAFNPAELLLAALSACMIKGMERVAPILKFEFTGVEVKLHGVRQDVPPKMESIEYEIIVDTKENDSRLELLHKNIKQYGTVFNTVTPGTSLTGHISRKKP